MTDSVRVSSDERGHGLVTVNGLDISPGVQAVTLRIVAGSVPQVHVDLAVFDVQGDVDADVVIPDGTRVALERLGWTAPDA